MSNEHSKTPESMYHGTLDKENRKPTSVEMGSTMHSRSPLIREKTPTHESKKNPPSVKQRFDILN